MGVILFELKGFLKLLFLTFITVSTSSEVLIVYSHASKSAAASLFADVITSVSNISLIEIFSCDFNFLDEEISKHPNLIAIFDITDNLTSQFKISKLCKDKLLIHFLVSESMPYKNNWTFMLSAPKTNLCEAFITTLKYFNWTTGVAFSSVKNYPIYQANLHNYSEKIDLFSASSGAFVTNFIQKEVLRLGSSLFYLFADNNSSIEIQKNLKSSKMLTNGTGILLISESSYGSTIEGALAIVEKGKETAESYEKYLYLTILDMISLLSNASSYDDSLIMLLEKCPNHYCVNGFSLVNIHENQRKFVGSITNGILMLNSSIVFPGNSVEIPISQKKYLYVSANDGTTNPDAAPSEFVILYNRGFASALKDMNTGNDILQNFQLKLNDFDCGAAVYNAAFNYNCINKDKDKLGLARIMASSSLLAYGEIATLAKLNITLPCIGALNVDSGLSNSTKYPFYSRVSVPSTVLFSQVPLILKVMGWRNIAILYQNDSLGTTANYYINQANEKQNLNIINKLKIIPPLLTRGQLKNYSHVFQDIIDTNARMIVLILNPPLIDYAAELFYDLGMRKGDMIFYSPNVGWLSSVANKDDYTYKRIEVAIPLLAVYQSFFVGEKGKSVHDDLYKSYGNLEPSSFSCLFYDSLYLVGAALDWTINQGKDYTDPTSLQSAIRSVKFAGCSGTIYMQKNSNDVQLTSFTIQSNFYNSTTSALKIYDVGLLAPTSLKVLTIETPFIYADGTSNKPTDFRITRTNCPFDDKLKQTFAKGRALVFGICFFIAVVTTIVTFVVWKKWWNLKVEELTKSEELSIADMIVGITIVVEFFQLLSQGPDIRPLNSMLDDIGDAVSLDVKGLLKFENNIFWWFYTAIIILCGLWCIFCIEIFWHLDETFNNIWFFRALGILADYSMPILGNLCFIPFISILLEVFVCDNSIGNDFKDSYLSIDCYQFCWQGSHIPYAILSTVSLICYHPFAVYCRPLWQEFQHELHVKSFPLYLMVKTVVQVVLIVMNKTIKRSNDIAHGFLFTFLVIFYILILLKFKAYNYERFNWWHNLTLAGVTWVSFLSTMNFLINGKSFPWISLILGGWGVLALIGLLVQKKKYPSLLFRKKGKDTSNLFKFAFSFGKKSKDHHSKIIPQKLDLLSSK
ncbi:unnamed protein product [Blepharisma stoltei]|uniref:Receptor ligand binding region domain-containing protein n=1 Tax=Blepharisma stoltei TaxID=1481888 RepID=A0AAU9JZL3_9CILI|nr:unnamed protein product [Blepharisma stoltei]